MLRRKNKLFKAAKSLAPLLFVTVNIASILPSHSETFSALCDEKAAREYKRINPVPDSRNMGPRKPSSRSSRSKCRVLITIDGEAISSPNTTIPVTRVTSWVGGGSSKTRVGVGVATTIIFGPIGLLGFLAKKHAYSFTINGYDVDGKKASISFGFKDEQQQKRLMLELPIVTGLGLGQQRSAEEIKKLEATGGKIEPASLDKFQEKTLYGNPTASETTNSNCGIVLRNYDCSYDKYLEANPTMKKWSELNPELATKERIRLKSVD